MIYELSRELESLMRERGWPHRIHYGDQYPRPEHVGHTMLIIRSAEGQPDRSGPPQGRGVNPQYIGVRELSGEAILAVRSSLPGAARQDHERECHLTLDMLQAAMHRAKANNWAVTPGAGRYLRASEVAEFALPELWNGVGYVLQFSVLRGVYDQTYRGDARPEGELTGFNNSTSVVLLGTGGDTACGA